MESKRASIAFRDIFPIWTWARALERLLPTIRSDQNKSRILLFRTAYGPEKNVCKSKKRSFLTSSFPFPSLVQTWTRKLAVFFISNSASSFHRTLVPDRTGLLSVASPFPSNSKRQKRFSGTFSPFFIVQILQVLELCVKLSREQFLKIKGFVDCYF